MEGGEEGSKNRYGWRIRQGISILHGGGGVGGGGGSRAIAHVPKEGKIGVFQQDKWGYVL